MLRSLSRTAGPCADAVRRRPLQATAILAAHRHVLHRQQLHHKLLHTTTARTASSSGPTTQLFGSASGEDDAADPALLPRNGLSHVVGNTSAPLYDGLVSDLLTRSATRSPDHLAAAFPEAGVRFTYAELDEHVHRLAAALHARGLRKGDRLAICAPNCYQWLAAQYASAALGVMLVKVNPAYQQQELAYALSKVGVKALIAMTGFRNADYLGMLSSSSDIPTLEFVVTVASRSETAAVPPPPPSAALAAKLPILSYDELLATATPTATAAARDIARTLSPSDIASIQYTSGTTALPKAVALSHRNIVNNGHFIARRMRLQPHEALVGLPPFYHCFGAVIVSLAGVGTGCSLVFPSEVFNARRALEAVHDHKAAALYGVPTMFSEVHGVLKAEPGRFDISTLRTGVMAGTNCPIALMRRCVSDLNMREITVCYGMTETSPVSFQAHVSDTVEDKVSTVGRVHPQVECKVVDSAGNTVAVGEEGELLTKGYLVMEGGYWGDDQKTAESIDADGFMHTGDLATLDERGYCRIVGRSKDTIIRGGENISPREVEEVLCTHPQVAQAQCFGVPDERLGEVVFAWLILAPAPPGSPPPAAADISAFCRERMARFKVPRPEHIAFVDSFPLTASGKPRKNVMRATVVKQLGLRED